MASTLSFFSLFLLTFLLNNGHLATARDIPISEIKLTQEPEEDYFIVKKRPAVIVCQAKYAADIIFTCMGTQIPPSSVEVEDLEETSPDTIQAKIEVSRADVQDFKRDKKPFWCECSALDVDETVAATSRRAYVHIAYLHRKFPVQPDATVATEGENVEFACKAPDGNPKPEIVWRRNKKRLNLDALDRYVLTDKGSLVIESVEPTDVGYYQCVAKNVMGKRDSVEAELVVNILAESAEPELEITGHEEGVRSGRRPRQSEGPVYVQEPKQEYHISPGENVTITCVTKGGGSHLFVKCNQVQMPKNEAPSEMFIGDDGKKSIVVNGVVTYERVQDFYSRSQNERFQCVCLLYYTVYDASKQAKWSTAESSPDLGYIKMTYIDKQFVVEPSDVTASLNTDAVMECEPPKGDPAPYLIWMKDRSRLDARNDPKYTINRIGHLIIHNAQYEDAGYYSCMAENSIDSITSRQAYLTVTAPVSTTQASIRPEGSALRFPAVKPKEPMFLMDLPSEKAFGPDGTATFSCTAVVLSQMGMYCFGPAVDPNVVQNEEIIDSATGMVAIKSTHTVTFAEYEQARQKDERSLFCKCVAWLYDYESQQWKRADGQKMDLKPMGEGMVEETGGAETSYIDDRFELTPSDLSAYYSFQAELVCLPPAGNPTPTIRWLKDNIPIDTDVDQNFVVIDGTLYIEYVEVENQGYYTCVAENPAGVRAARPVYLTVVGEPTMPTTPYMGREHTTDYDDTDYTTAMKDPYILHQPDAQYYLTRNMPAEVQCSIVNVKSVGFSCNGEVIRETLSSGYTTVDPETMMDVSFNAFNITREMVESYYGDGPFTCVCQGYSVSYEDPTKFEVTETAPFTFEVAFLRKNFRESPRDTNVRNQGTLELYCSPPEGAPEPLITWLKDDYPVVEDNRVKVKRGGNLMIMDFNYGDQGRYTCVAENIAHRRMTDTVVVMLSDATEEEIRPGHGTGSESRPDGGQPEPEPTDSGVNVHPVDSPYISKDLHSVYYLKKKEPVMISCEAYNVEYITFSCGMVDVPVTETDRMVEATDSYGNLKMQKVVEGTVEVSRKQVEDYAGSDYWCQCYAHYIVPGMQSYQTLESQMGKVEFAYLKKNFVQDPKASQEVVMEGDYLVITCSPPDGNPVPTVTWKKDGEDLVPTEFITVDSNSGSLYFEEMRLEDTGDYMCVATNEAGMKASNPVFVEVKAGDGIPTDSMASGNKCSEMLQNCNNIVPNINDIEYCGSADAFRQCLDQFKMECKDNDSLMMLIAVTMSKIDERCAMPQCSAVHECKSMYTNSPDSSMGPPGILMPEFCANIDNYVECLDMKLPACNMSMLEPEEGVRASGDDVVDWLKDYCNRTLYINMAAETCPELAQCYFPFNNPSMDNSTYYCSVIGSILECSRDAVDQCDVDELRNDLEYLYNQAKEYSCSDDDMVGTAEPETGPEPEGQPDGEPEGETTDGDGDDDDDDTDTEGSIEASVGDNENGSATLGVSAVLLTLVQLLVAAVLSQR